jgi:hypothetical protein
MVEVRLSKNLAVHLDGRFLNDEFVHALRRQAAVSLVQRPRRMGTRIWAA